MKRTHHLYMGVSKNNGTPKSSILIGFSTINHPFWGTPIFGNTHVATTAGGIPNFSQWFQCLRHFLKNPKDNSYPLPLDSPLRKPLDSRYLLHIVNYATHLYQLYSKPLLYKDLGSLWSIMECNHRSFVHHTKARLLARTGHQQG